jgi:hypothetical protein
MLHVLAAAICLIAALALMAGAIWTVVGPSRSAQGFGHAIQHPLEQYVDATRLGTDVMFGTADSPSTTQEGWSLIDRASRARRDGVRLAVR